jgi:beta-lactamase regulating signal transducer with metallopeptidase domain
MNWQGLGFAVGKWALWNSAGAAVVVVLLLAVQRLWGNQISARWRHNLWLLVAVRLILPAMPGLAISIPQWLKPAPNPKIVAVAPSQPVVIPINVASPEVVSKADFPGTQFTGPIIAPTRDTADKQPAFDVKTFETNAKPEFFEAVATSAPVVADSQTANRQTATSLPPSVQVSRKAPTSPAPAIQAISWKLWALAAWTLGMFLMLTRLALNTLQLRRLTDTFQRVDDADLHDLLADCCRRIGIKRPPMLVKGPSGFGPALIGLWRPRLILPARVLKKFSRSEIRSILLHELMHLRRRDVLINYLIALLQAVHWFNPLVWIGFSKIRAERELACDEAVLSLSPARDRLPYGCTILKLLETMGDGGMPVGAVGVVQHKGLVQRRINMIARFSGERRNRPVTAILMSALVGGAALTATSLAQDKPVEAAPKVAAPTLTPPSAVDNARVAVEAAASPKPVSGSPDAMLVQTGPAAAPSALPAPAMRPAYGAPEPVQVTPPATPNRRSRDAAQRTDNSPRTIEDASATIADAKTAERLKHLQPLDANGLPLREVLNMIADVGKVDIVTDDQSLANAGVDPNVAVNIRLRDPRPLEQILEMSLRLASPQVDYTILDGVIFVASRAELNAHTVTRVYDIGNADHSTLNELLINGTGLVPHTAYIGDKLVITASELTQRHVAKLLSAVSDQMSKRAAGQTSNRGDGSLRTTIFALKYADAQSLKSVLATACSPGCFLAVDGRTNSLIVKGADDDLNLADEVIRKLDTPASKVEKSSNSLPDWVAPRLEALRDLYEKATAKRMQVGAGNPEYRAMLSHEQVVQSELEALMYQLRKDGNELASTNLRRELDLITSTFSESPAKEKNTVDPEELNRLSQQVHPLVRSLDENLTKRGHDHPITRQLEERLKVVKEQLESRSSNLGDESTKAKLQAKIGEASAEIDKFEKQQSGTTETPGR